MPEVEEREVALFNGYTWRVWQELPYEERRDGVAHFRLHHLIEMHRQDAAIQDAESKAKRRR